jgi:multidrug resistance efflux pump
MKDDNQSLVAFFVTLLVVLGLAIMFSYRNVSNHEVPATDTTDVNRHWQDV